PRKNILRKFNGLAIPADTFYITMLFYSHRKYAQKQNHKFGKVSLLCQRYYRDPNMACEVSYWS
ncbi:MAG: hypothetical protein OEY00_05695, partial [Gammaproteobacteria bacterium]|nr:hypothetical protein [Gammaproteobacteria bacterium]